MVKWLKNSVFYEIYPSSFYDGNGDGMGDIAGITAKLDYITELGCNALWLNPCYKSAFKDGGYDITDHKTVDERFGTNEDLIGLFKAAHAKGIKVVLDLVPGHTSDRHPWFVESCRPEKNEFTHRYVWTDTVYEAPPDFRTVNGTTDRDGNYIVNYFSSQPALNYGFANPEKPWQLPYTHPDCVATKNALIDLMRFWLDAGCDGFRVDMAQSLIKNDKDSEVNIKLWQDIFAQIRPDYPHAAFISEWFNFEQSFAAGFDADFYNTHAYMSFTRTHLGDAALSYFNPGNSCTAAQFFREFDGFHKQNGRNGYMAVFTGNHDFARLNAFNDPVLYKIAVTCLMTLPGLPFLYYGDEIGLRHSFGLSSKEGGYYRTGARTPMQWDDTRNSGFSEAAPEKLFLPVNKALNPQSAASLSLDADSVFYAVKEIIKLRKANESLWADAPFELVYTSCEHPTVIYKRGGFTFFLNAKAFDDTVPLMLKEQKIVYGIGNPPNFGDNVTVSAKSFFICKR